MTQKKRQNNRLFVAIEIALIAVMFGAGAYAAVTSVTDVENEISVGAVNIELEHYHNDGSEEENGVYDGEDIAEKTSISSIPRITNLGISSYVRLLVNYYDKDGNVAERAPVGDLGADWQAIGDYYYLTRAATTGESLDVFKSISVPASWNNDNDKIVMILRAEAIQSANFEPDFTSEQPWGVVSIEEFNGDYQIDSEDHTSAVTVSYDDSANKYVEVPDNFLASLNLLAPGDTVTGELQINNTDSKDHEIWMDLEVSNGDLGDTLRITITKDGEVLYDGTTAGLENFSLGNYSSGSGATITVAISLPREVTNGIGGVGGTINWSFKTDKSEEPIPDTPSTNDNIVVAVIIFLVSFAGLIFTFMLEKRQKEE